jgi:hypothetical protein
MDYDKKARELWTDVFHGCEGHDHGHISAVAAALRESAAQAYEDAATYVSVPRAALFRQVAAALRQKGSGE